MKLRLAHLSDIHFTCLGENGHLDLDGDLRNELEYDLKNIVEKSGKIDAVLVGGDIAFSAKEEEYRKASEWLKKICVICECEDENVLTVPGNHDVNRKACSPIIMTTHKEFKDIKDIETLNKKFTSILCNNRDLDYLQTPLVNYRNFAQKYNTISSDNKLYWEKDFPLGLLTLRIRGLNSAFISNRDDDEHKSKLVLGSHQTILKREDGVIYLTLCHHPSQWLYDGESASRNLNVRARVQLFGHKHDFHINKIDNSILLSAGAVHPSRSENNWEPRYNVIELDIIENKSEKVLNIKIWERIWDKKTLKFIPKFDSRGREFMEFDLILDENESKIVSTVKKTCRKENIPSSTYEVEKIEPNKPDSIRKLQYAFVTIPYHIRSRIVSKLELVKDSDQNLKENDKNKAYLKRAAKMNLLGGLWDEIKANTNELKETINPFK